MASLGASLPRQALVRFQADLDDVVARADDMVTRFTGLPTGGPPTRPWAMTRGDWVERNLRGLESVVGPLSDHLFARRPEGALSGARRKLMGGQVGLLLGYLGRKVLGQYDLFLPPDDREVLYFVAPNIAAAEARFGFRPADFRLWIALHEVTHRVQFTGVPWLRRYVGDLIDTYLRSIDLDARRLAEGLRRLVEEARSGGRWREMGWLYALLTPAQQDVFRRMQAVMAVLEGHGNYVMDVVGEDVVEGAGRMRRVLHERRNRGGVDRFVQRAVGLDVKVRQYDLGQRFILKVVERTGQEGFARVWERPENLPTLEEVARPEAWVERVATA